MKTISGQPISTKQISLSKAAKILSKFVSAENGASHVITAYLHRASASFNELNKLHKDLKSPRSHQKHKRRRTETHYDGGRVMENSICSVETTLNHGIVQSKKSTRHHFGSENADEEEEVKMVQKKKRKNEDVEDGSGDLNKKRMKKKMS